MGGPRVQLLNATIANSGDVHGVGDVTTQQAVSKALVAAALEQPLKMNRRLRTSNGFPLRFGARSGHSTKMSKIWSRERLKEKLLELGLQEVICKHV